MKKALALVILAGSLALTGCGPQETSAPVTGAQGESVSGTETSVFLPVGELTLTVGEPVTEVAGDQTADGTAYRASGDDVLVPVSWGLKPLDVSIPGRVLMVGDPLPARVSVTGGGERFVLGSPYTVDGRQTVLSADRVRYVPLSDAKSLTFEVTYDGLTQTVTPANGKREARVAAPLYDEPAAAEKVECPSSGWRAGRDAEARLTCSVSKSGSAPYLDGVGWAPEGSTFASVTVDVKVDSLSVAGERVEPTPLTGTFLLDGKKTLPLPASVGQHIGEEPNGRLLQSLVFQMPVSGTHRLTLDLRYGGHTLSRSIPLA